MAESAVRDVTVSLGGLHATSGVTSLLLHDGSVHGAILSEGREMLRSPGVMGDFRLSSLFNRVQLLASSVFNNEHKIKLERTFTSATMRRAIVRPDFTFDAYLN